MAQDAPDMMPLNSRLDLFTFYTPGDTHMPSGSDLTSKALIYITGIDAELANSRNYGGSTAFIIRTFRNDNKICACMTGHQAEKFMGVAHITTVPDFMDINNKIYMDFTGQNEVRNDVDYVKVNNYSSADLQSVELVEYFNDALSRKDAALFLIDKKYLPSENFAALGYDFENSVNPQSDEHFYSMGHPWNYPQRIAYDGTYSNGGDTWMDIALSKPFAVGGGGSGSPFLNQSSGSGANTSVKGIFAQGIYSTEIREKSVNGGYYPYSYATLARMTRMSVLQNAIREHCWKGANKDQISSSAIYKQSVMVSNPKPALNVDQVIGSPTDVSGSSAAYTETVSGGKKLTQLTARNCTVGSFTLPVTYPGSTATEWRVVFSAKQIDVNPGFNYTASGNSELNLSVVSSYRTSVTSRLADAADTASNSSVASSVDAPGFKLYPNPSPDGVFFLELPAAEKDIVYTGSIMGADGKLVQQLDHMQGGTKVNFNLSQQPRGMYLLNVYNPEGRLVFATKITLQ
ncbi:hypothetical protein GCM10023092_26960 [Rurimicrobium arvi]|uniref:Secretion system C-terminal sorting domain-containing protein n=2 Tax=Rurimicrobium arvi TaxID=2049916 RepID=A0ABP8N1U4_9BACT